MAGWAARFRVRPVKPVEHAMANRDTSESFRSHPVNGGRRGFACVLCSGDIPAHPKPIRASSVRPTYSSSVGNSRERLRRHCGIGDTGQGVFTRDICFKAAAADRRFRSRRRCCSCCRRYDCGSPFCRRCEQTCVANQMGMRRRNQDRQFL